ncbi:TIM barrel protein [Roseovarius sp. CAU 1744]|uniref:sugar phosphate isomerase/epimerase family protein n=1 Tax=Roseovarius sp. CAU 1744 TaxID=3140368 RepID=UPI00325B4DEE
MTAVPLQLGLHTYSFENHFRYAPGFDVFDFIRLARFLKLSGVHISMNDEHYRWVGGTSVEQLHRVGKAVRDAGLFLEVDTSGTDPAHLARVLKASREMGADRLRTYTAHTGTPEEQLAKTTRDLKVAAPIAADHGIAVLLENHEDFTGAEVARIIDAVDHPNIGALFDFGNSMMVLEEPMAAAQAMAPHVRTVHVKDQIVVQPDAAPRPIVCGAPIGRGNIDVAGILDYVTRASGLERICIQSVYAYAAPIVRNLDRFRETSAASPTFRVTEQRTDESLFALDHRRESQTDLARLLNFELSAVAYGVGRLRTILGQLGFAIASE